MLFDQDTIKQIQAIAFDAYKTTGRVAALLDGGGDGNRSLAQEMSAAAFRLERGTAGGAGTIQHLYPCFQFAGQTRRPCVFCRHL